jgi:uncharacterized membrane protein
MRDVMRGRLRTLGIVLGTLPLLALLAAPVQAVDVLTVTTPYPTVEVDPGGTVKLPLSVQTPTATKVDLSLNGVPQGWDATFHGGGFIVTSVYPNGNAASPAPTDLELQVIVPATAKPGSNQFTIHASTGTSTADLPIDLVVAQSGGGTVSFTTDVPAKRGTPGSAVSFDLTLHNDTATEQSFTLAIPDAPAGWTVTAQPAGQTGATTFKVAAGDTSSISVSATSAADTSAGDYTFTVVASAGNQYNAQQQLGVQLAGTSSLSVTSGSGVLNTTATAGSSTDFSVVVTNTGSSPLSNISLSSSPPTNWKVTYTPASIASLDPNGTTTVTAAIQPAGDAVAGDYVVTLTATSGTATGSIDVRTQVQASTLWGYIGIAIIALVVIGLLFVFRRYGRR